jgi:RepB DNA-primase from phage plasmid
VTNLDEASRMVDTFAGCGATSFVVTKTELEWPDRKKAKWGKDYSLDALREKLPAIVRTAAIRHPVRLPDGQEVMAGENVIIRPTGPDVAFVQLDDLKTQEQLERVRPAALIIHATSPGNYQAWVAVSGVPEGKESFRMLMRRVRKAVGGNDKAASHATRLAGTENFKAAYGPDFPVVRIIEAHPGRVMTEKQLEAMGLLAAPEAESTKSDAAIVPRRTGPSDYRSPKNKVWPSYAISLAGAPRNDSGTGPDRSMADFNWCMTAIDWRWPIEETAAKLTEVSEKARQRVQLGDVGYPLITAQNAAAAVERNVLKRGRG